MTSNHYVLSDPVVTYKVLVAFVMWPTGVFEVSSMKPYPNPPRISHLACHTSNLPEGYKKSTRWVTRDLSFSGYHRRAQVNTSKKCSLVPTAENTVPHAQEGRFLSNLSKLLQKSSNVFPKTQPRFMLHSKPSPSHIVWGMSTSSVLLRKKRSERTSRALLKSGTDCTRCVRYSQVSSNDHGATWILIRCFGTVSGHLGIWHPKQVSSLKVSIIWFI